MNTLTQTAPQTTPQATQPAGTHASAPAGNPSAQAARQEPALLPPVDVVEDATGITLYADLPGVPRELLNLRVEGDQLAIEADMRLPAQPELQASHAEVTLSRYRRTFTLSKELDGAKVSAELSHGVLRVRIPKAEHAQPRRISVQVA